MAKNLEIYRCSICGNIVEVVHGSSGVLVCCGKPMKLLRANTTDAATEKHVPVINKKDGGYNIKIGSTAHPMTEDHYIQWIEIVADGRSYRKFLNPGDAPEAFFEITAAKVSALAYCNLHGLWQAKL